MITTRHETLGALISRFRQSKHIGVNQLIEECGISRSTYSRIVADQLIPDLQILAKILSVLHMSYDDDADCFPGADESYEAQVQALVSQFNKSSLTPGELHKLQLAITDAQVQFKAKATDGNALLVNFSQFLLAAHLQQHEQCVILSHRIFAMLDVYQEWNDFEIMLLTPIAGYMSSDALANIFPRLKAKNSATLASSNPYKTIRDNELLYHVLETAITRHAVTLLTATIDHILAREIKAFGLQSTVLKKFAAIVQLVLANQPDQALADLERLTAVLNQLDATINQYRIGWLHTQLATFKDSEWQQIIHK